IWVWDATPLVVDAPNNLGIAREDKGQRDASAHYDLGVALQAKRQWDEAIAEYREAIDIDPKYAEAYYNLGRALWAKRKVDDAIAAYRKAIAIDAKDAEFHWALGSALSEKGRFAEAKTSAQTALNLLRRGSTFEPTVSQQLQHYQMLLALEAK